MGTVHPRLEVGDRSVHTWQQLVFWRSARLFAWTVLIAELGQAAVGVQPVGVDDRPRGRSRLRECLQRLGPGVGQHLKSQTPRASSSDLDCGAHQGLLAALAAALETFLIATEPKIVDLDLLRRRLRSGATIARRSFWSISHAVS